MESRFIEVFGVGIELSWLLHRGVAVAAVVVFGVLIYVAGRTLIQRAAQPKHTLSDAARVRSEGTRRLVVRGWRVTMLLVVAIGLLSLLPAATGFVAVIVVVGALGVLVASRTFARDVVAGLVVLLEGQLAAGDRVRLEGVDVEGVVEEVGWRTTLIRASDGAAIFVPNGAVTTVRVRSGAAAATEDGRRQRPARRRGGGGRQRTGQTTRGGDTEATASSSQAGEKPETASSRGAGEPEAEKQGSESRPEPASGSASGGSSSRSGSRSGRRSGGGRGSRSGGSSREGASRSGSERTDAPKEPGSRSGSERTDAPKEPDRSPPDSPWSIE